MQREHTLLLREQTGVSCQSCCLQSGFHFHINRDRSSQLPVLTHLTAPAHRETSLLVCIYPQACLYL